ncbi:hypothetical protein HaLaN_26768, partial [Haematococcus lacustris]
MHGAPAISRR